MIKDFSDLTVNNQNTAFSEFAIKKMMTSTNFKTLQTLDDINKLKNSPNFGK